MAEPAPKTVDDGVVAVASGQALAAGLSGDLLQARELCLGLACGAVDRATEGVVTGAGRFMSVGAAESIAGAPASPFGIQKGVAILHQALAQPS